MNRPSPVVAWAPTSAAVGVGATAVMDQGGEVIRRTTGVAPLDYGLVGRRIGHMRHGQFAHDGIGAAAPVRGERVVGTLVHYGIGTAVAAALMGHHPTSARRPTLGPAIAVGVGSTAAPWLIMQPAFGMGIAGARTPDPTTVRLRSLRTHAIFGVGLHLAGQATRRALPTAWRSDGRFAVNSRTTS